VNPAAELMFGSDRTVMIGLPAEELATSVLGSGAAVAAMVTALQAGESWSGYIPLPGDAGGVGSSIVFAVRGDDGEPVGFAALNRDVTEKRTTGDQLARAEKQWRSMLDVAPVGLALVSLDGQFQRVNPALSRIVGYSAEKLTQLTFPEITYPEDLGADLTLMGKLLAGEVENYTLEKRYVHLHGHIVWVQLSVALIRDEETGRPEQFVVAIENITQRRQANERLAAIIAGASDAFVGIAPAGYVTEWNASAEKLFGWTRGEALGRPLTALIIPAEQHEAHRAGLERLRNNEPGRILGRPIELVARTKDDGRVPVELTVWRANGADTGGGSAGEFYAFIRDSTERIRAGERQAAIAIAQSAIAAVELSPRKVMQEICRHAQQLTGADAAAVAVREGDEMVYRAVSGTAQASLGLRVPVGGSLSGLAVTTDEPLISHNSRTDPRVHAAANEEATRARSIVVVPLHTSTGIQGVVTVLCERPGRFTDEDCSTLSLLAAPFGSALSNAWRLEATRQQATTDPVTGLGNRAHALLELEKALERRGRRKDRRQDRRQGGEYIGVLFIDLDHFKKVNDTRGHAAGDEVLVAVADRLRAALRSGDTPNRYGGDEFLVICENITSPEAAAELAARLVAIIAGTYILTPSVASGVDDDLTAALAEIGASVGIAVTSAEVSVENLLAAADEAMYEAKQAGGNSHAVRVVD
jgi:diguanylate cyclase (GGDEF)-like protein/PAS domain S-box-containing protein